MTLDVERLEPWIGGGVRHAAEAASIPLISPVDESTVAHVVDSDGDVVDSAVKSAHAAYLAHRDVTTATRLGWLDAVVKTIEEVEEDIVHSLLRDIGKPRRAAIFEARRTSQFVRACAAQLPHLNGEVLPLDVAMQGAGRFGFTTRVPYGVVGAVTPFNAPANLLIQKVAPAIAMGNAVVAKPSPPATKVALVLAEAFKRANVPDGLFNVVPGGRDTALKLAAHPKVALVTLTGSTAAGHDLVRAAGAKRFLAELGSNAANIVCADADLPDAALRIASSGFEASGQQCISAQRVIVEQSVYAQFLDLFVKAAKALTVGLPDNAKVDVGPMVSRAAADRVEAMIADAVSKGAKLALAPTRDGCILSPTIVTDAPPNARVLLEEAFGPIVVVQSAASVSEALDMANASEFGLQGACFTASLETAFKVSRAFNVGSLWINEGSRFRLDSYPFGGVGSSGFGREGVRYAMEEMSQWKFIGMRLQS